MSDNSNNEDYMLTTIDNPFNPFDRFDEWYQFDVSKGYNTCAYLARIANTSPALSDALNENEIDNAMNEIIKFNGKLYKKIKKGEKTEPINVENLLINVENV